MDEQEDFMNWEKKRDSLWTKVSQQVKAIHVILVVVIVLFAQSQYASERISKNTALVVVVPIIALVLFLMFRESKTPKLIPEHIIKQIALETLERKRVAGKEIPFDSKVRVTLVGEPIYETDLYTGTSGIIKREVGFEMIRKGLRKTGVIGVHPYTGIVLGIRWERLGYSGKESKDRVIIPVGFVERKVPSPTA